MGRFKEFLLNIYPEFRKPEPWPDPDLLIMAKAVEILRKTNPAKAAEWGACLNGGA